MTPNCLFHLQNVVTSGYIILSQTYSEVTALEFQMFRQLCVQYTLSLLSHTGIR